MSVSHDTLIICILSSVVAKFSPECRRLVFLGSVPHAVKECSVPNSANVNDILTHIDKKRGTKPTQSFEFMLFPFLFV